MPSAPALASLVALLVPTAQEPAPPEVELVRAPEDGLQPRAVLDASGTLHVVYFIGAPGAGDLRWVRSKDGGKSFDAPRPVNQRPHSAMATGNVRGAQLALGRDGRLHVLWNGVVAAEHAPSDREPEPLLYTRLDDARAAFEPERDLIAKRHGLDGGSALAADGAGNVYVAWHAPGDAGEGEDARRVWLVVSRDDGRTFGDERAVSPPDSGVCPCCGMGAFARTNGGLALLYRRAHGGDQRDAVLLVADDPARGFETRLLDAWKVPTCVMSTFSAARGPRADLGAWECEGRIRFGELSAKGGARTASGDATKCRHPSIASNAAGQVLVAWIEDMEWATEGKLAWRVFDAGGKAIEGASGRRDGVPRWDLPQAIALADGSFRILY